MVAGFLAGYLEKKDYEYAFHMGIASGSASAFSEQLATRAEVGASVGKQYIPQDKRFKNGGVMRIPDLPI